MVAISGEMHKELGLPYRRLLICTGDLGAGKYKRYDTEAWLPGMNRWAETGSASNFLDWQSRRLNVKYTDTKKGEKKYVYMLNNTALPSPRVFIAILEELSNEGREDRSSGSVAEIRRQGGHRITDARACPAPGGSGIIESLAGLNQIRF